jgi:dipeptidase E
MYFKQLLSDFKERGISFERASTVDGRVSPEAARQAVAEADVLWLSGGNAYKQIDSIIEYGLIPVMRERGGVTVGMSAGAINMAKTAVCRPYGNHKDVKVYPGIGLVDISVAPHYGSASFLYEMLYITRTHPLYCLSDDSFIVAENGEKSFFGDVFYVENEEAKRISNSNDR